MRAAAVGLAGAVACCSVVLEGRAAPPASAGRQQVGAVREKGQAMKWPMMGLIRPE